MLNGLPNGSSKGPSDPSPSSDPSPKSPPDRLDSWKEIASHLNRDVTTVQRWEKREGMPVHRHLHDKMGSVYASRAELDAWSNSRKLPPPPENKNENRNEVGNEGENSASVPPEPSTKTGRSPAKVIAAIVIAALLVFAAILWLQKSE